MKPWPDELVHDGRPVEDRVVLSIQPPDTLHP